jgi:hypothetical protein
MMAESTHNHLLIAACGLFAAGVIVGTALAPRVLAPAPAAVARGNTLADFFADDILSVTYTTQSSLTTAQRSTPGARFQVQSTFADGRPVQHCSASSDLAGHLPRFAEITAKRGLSLDQRDQEFPVQLGVLDIRNTVIGEPAGPVLVFSNAEGSSVAVILDGYAAEVNLPVSEFKWLERACETAAVSDQEPGIGSLSYSPQNLR